MYTPNIVIEGGDKTGKSTLQKQLLHKYPFSKRYFISDRSIMTRMIYGAIRNEFDPMGLWKQDLVNFLCNNAMIVLHADGETVEKRYLKEGDDEHKLSDIKAVNQLYRDAIETWLGSINFVNPIDTSFKSADEITDEAAVWIGNITHYDLFDKVRNLMSLVLALGQPIGLGKELRNVRLATHKPFMSQMNNIVLCDESKQYVEKAPLDKLTKARYEMDIQHHDSFYKYLFNSLFYKIESEIKFHHENPLTSRRFHIVPPQGSCTTSLGVNFRENNARGVDMFCTVNMRSSDIVILPFDIYNAQRVFIDIIRPQAAIPLFGQRFANKIQNFFFNYNFESVHVLDAESFKLDYNYM